MYAVQDELSKAAKSNATITQLKNEFESHLQGEVIKNYAAVQQAAQKTKDEYHQLFSAAMQDCATKYTEIDTLANELIKEIESLPSGLNQVALAKS